MSKKIWWIIGTALVVVGGIMFAAVMTVYNWDFTKLSTQKYETSTYQVDDDFSSISIETDTEDITFVPSEDGGCKVVCYGEEDRNYIVEVEDNTLTIGVEDERKWYGHIGIGFEEHKITVYLPKGEYDVLKIKESTGEVEIPKDFTFGSVDVSITTGDVQWGASVSGMLKIHTNTGDIKTEDISAGEVDILVTTGRVNVKSVVCSGDIKLKVNTGKSSFTDVNCKNFTTNGSTGDISLENVIATEKLCIERDTGDVRLEGCDAGEIFIQTDTGSVSGSLLTDKIFIAETDTGRVNVPKSTRGGICEITTDTGDIKMEIE